jgi:cytochrome c5
MRIVLMAGLVLAGCAPTVEFACDIHDCLEPPTPPTGDPEAGRRVLYDGGLMTCGVPLSVYRRFEALLGEQVTLPDRRGDAEGLPYNVDVGTSIRGVKVVNQGCFHCHAGPLDGTIVPGLGNHVKGDSGSLELVELALGLVDDPDEVRELEVALEMLRVSDALSTDTRGVSTGNFKMMAVAARRDPETHAWLDEPHMEPPRVAVPHDVPPWWNTRYKGGLFANTAARGDVTAFTLNPAHVCTESEAMAERVLSHGPDVAAYIRSLEPPAWPYGLDEAAVRRGRRVFEATCARCHGTYRGPDAEDVDYPGVVVPAEVVGTDPLAARERDTWQRAWDEHFAHNVFGAGTTWAPQEGYVAPPLRGIWASAPYFHNGSVPTLAGVLDSRDRPAVWRRRDLEGLSYDRERVGWDVEILEAGKAAASDPEARFEIVDTSREGYANTGHPYGDGLEEADRADLLEYLRSL